MKNLVHISRNGRNLYSIRAQGAFEALIHGQCIDEQGLQVAHALTAADPREARLLREQRENTVKAYDLVLSLEDSPSNSPIKDLLRARLSRNMHIDYELWLHDQRENAKHGQTVEHWDDSRENRLEACGILDGLRETVEPTRRTSARGEMITERDL